MTEGAVERTVVKVSADGVQDVRDFVAVEEPLEMRLAGDVLAVTMRTPGHDADLVVGFLLAEGIIRSADDIGGIMHCGRVGEPGYGNVIDVVPAPGVALDPERSRRGTLATSACGVCGRQQIDDLLARVQPLADDVTVSLERVLAAPPVLGAEQVIFQRTGGLHGAALLDRNGMLLASAEDVGRHNAVDKVVGRCLRRPPDAAPALLVVSGRVSFEIVQKAAMIRTPVIIAVSAPTSLAVDLATQSRIAIAGFARGDRVNLYGHVARIQG